MCRALPAPRLDSVVAWAVGAPRASPLVLVHALEHQQRALDAALVHDAALADVQCERLEGVVEAAAHSEL